MSCSSITSTVSNSSLCEKVVAVAAITLLVGGIIAATQFPVGTGQFYAGVGVAVVSPLFLVGLVVNHKRSSKVSEREALREEVAPSLRTVDERREAYQAGQLARVGYLSFRRDRCDLFAGRMISSLFNEVTIRNSQTGEVESTLSVGGNYDSSPCSACSPDGRFFVLGLPDRQFNLYDPSMNHLGSYVAAGEDCNLADMKFSQDGNSLMVAVTRGNSYFSNSLIVDMLDTTTWTSRGSTSIEKPDGSIQDIHPETQNVLIMERQKLTVYKMDSSRVAIPIEHNHSLEKALFSPDGQSVLTFESSATDCTISVWNLETMEKITFRTQENVWNRGVLKDMQFSPDGAFFVTLGLEKVDSNDHLALTVFDSQGWLQLQKVTWCCSEDEACEATLTVGLNGDCFVQHGSQSSSYCAIP